MNLGWFSSVFHIRIHSELDTNLFPKLSLLSHAGMVCCPPPTPPQRRSWVTSHFLSGFTSRRSPGSSREFRCVEPFSEEPPPDLGFITVPLWKVFLQGRRASEERGHTSPPMSPLRPGAAIPVEVTTHTRRGAAGGELCRFHPFLCFRCPKQPALQMNSESLTTNLPHEAFRSAQRPISAFMMPPIPSQDQEGMTARRRAGISWVVHFGPPSAFDTFNWK